MSFQVLLLGKPFLANLEITTEINNSEFLIKTEFEVFEPKFMPMPSFDNFVRIFLLKNNTFQFTFGSVW